jgi:hypothetical protein
VGYPEDGFSRVSAPMGVGLWRVEFVDADVAGGRDGETWGHGDAGRCRVRIWGSQISEVAENCWQTSLEVGLYRWCGRLTEDHGQVKGLGLDRSNS